MAFKIANRDYFAASISDRGDAYFEQFADVHQARLAESHHKVEAYLDRRVPARRSSGHRPRVGDAVGLTAARRPACAGSHLPLVSANSLIHGLLTV